MQIKYYWPIKRGDERGIERNKRKKGKACEQWFVKYTPFRPKILNHFWNSNFFKEHNHYTFKYVNLQNYPFV